MMYESPEMVREWLLNDDMESLTYQLSSILLKSGFKIIESNTTNWDLHKAESWILDEGFAFLRSFNSHEKFYFELSSFNHQKYLSFVIKLKSI